MVNKLKNKQTKQKKIKTIQIDKGKFLREKDLPQHITWKLVEVSYSADVIESLFDHILNGKEINFKNNRFISAFPGVSPEINMKTGQIGNIMYNEKSLRDFINNELDFDKLEIIYTKSESIKNPTFEDIKNTIKNIKNEKIMEMQLSCSDYSNYNRKFSRNGGAYGFSATTDLKEKDPVWKFSTTSEFEFCADCGNFGHSNCGHKEKVFKNGKINYPLPENYRLDITRKVGKETIKMPSKEEIFKILEKAIKEAIEEKNKNSFNFNKRQYSKTSIKR